VTYLTVFDDGSVDLVVVAGLAAGAVVVVLVVVVAATVGGTVTAGVLAAGVVVTFVFVTVVVVGAVVVVNVVCGRVFPVDCFVTVVVGDTAVAGFAVAVVVLVLLIEAGAGFVVDAAAAVREVALCTANGIWTTVSGDLPVSGSIETRLSLWAVVAKAARLKRIVQPVPPAAGKTNLF
jgi:hypothetical protein